MVMSDSIPPHVKIQIGSLRPLSKRMLGVIRAGTTYTWKAYSIAFRMKAVP